MTLIKQALLTGGLASAALLTAVSAQAVTVAQTGNTTVKIGGYVKLDMLFSDFSDGPVTNDGTSTTSFAREFYVPVATPVTPVNGTDRPSNTYFDMHARQTRINFSTESKIGEHKLKSYIEVDFMATVTNANNIVTNGYSPELRHAFIEYDKWLFGQTWSTFQNVESLPESVDFIGNTDGGIFVRQPQVRYTSGPWEFAIENPETTRYVTGGGIAATSDNEWPDLVGRYNLKHNDLSLALALLLRQLAYNNGTSGAGAIDDKESAYGIGITGKYMIGKDDIRFGINTGSGMGRYIALDTAPDAGLDSNGNLEAIDSTGLFASFRHHWNQKWRSNFMYSRLDIDNNTALAGIGNNTTQATWSARANLMTDPVKNLTLGGEFTLANREVESGADGDLTRLQFMAMYKF